MASLQCIYCALCDEICELLWPLFHAMLNSVRRSPPHSGKLIPVPIVAGGLKIFLMDFSIPPHSQTVLRSRILDRIIMRLRLRHLIMAYIPLCQIQKTYAFLCGSGSSKENDSALSRQHFSQKTFPLNRT
jgi:hypothetical protein